ncbi:hypothetical protein DFH05DRAFT_1531535 [Lentinula detonsa]|nr:hypothetical protein DFH05DRAFT_1531535 [Lentinula detonsa]
MEKDKLVNAKEAQEDKGKKKSLYADETEDDEDIELTKVSLVHFEHWDEEQETLPFEKLAHIPIVTSEPDDDGNELILTKVLHSNVFLKDAQARGHTIRESDQEQSDSEADEDDEDTDEDDTQSPVTVKRAHKPSAKASPQRPAEPPRPTKPVRKVSAKVAHPAEPPQPTKPVPKVSDKVAHPAEPPQPTKSIRKVSARVSRPAEPPQPTKTAPKLAAKVLGDTTVLKQRPASKPLIHAPSKPAQPICKPTTKSAPEPPVRAKPSTSTAAPTKAPATKPAPKLIAQANRPPQQNAVAGPSRHANALTLCNDDEETLNEPPRKRPRVSSGSVEVRKVTGKHIGKGKQKEVVIEKSKKRKRDEEDRDGAQGRGEQRRRIAKLPIRHP